MARIISEEEKKAHLLKKGEKNLGAPPRAAERTSFFGLFLYLSKKKTDED